MELGADRIVSEGVSGGDQTRKKWAMRVAGTLVAGGAADVLRHEALEEVLAGDGCDSNCEAFCEAAGLRDCSASERRRLLREGVALA
ncbi:hypothetical protein FGB62_22g341 [Gracilaria domingensis]|nr:hypothetical protein FGB62_22g341 [Gracilaria domingensis]